jgi:hypothetical protein
MGQRGQRRLLVCMSSALQDIKSCVQVGGRLRDAAASVENEAPHNRSRRVCELCAPLTRVADGGFHRVVRFDYAAGVQQGQGGEIDTRSL